MITLVYSYYENGMMLERHLQEWESYALHVKQSFRAVIIDDGSPNDPAAGHMREVGFPVELYRIKQNLVWNVPGARNLGMKMAPEGWCLLTDIDHLLPAHQAELLLSKRLHARHYYMLARRWADGRSLYIHSNSFVLERELYWRIGGCDEDFTGFWGAGEGVFRAGLMKEGVREDWQDVYLAHYGRADIEDASTREWGRRGTEYDHTLNPVLRAKSKRAPYKPERPFRFDWEKI